MLKLLNQEDDIFIDLDNAVLSVEKSMRGLFRCADNIRVASNEHVKEEMLCQLCDLEHEIINLSEVSLKSLDRPEKHEYIRRQNTRLLVAQLIKHRKNSETSVEVKQLLALAAQALKYYENISERPILAKDVDKVLPKKTRLTRL